MIGAISKFLFSSKQEEVKSSYSRQNDVAQWVTDKVVNKVGGDIYTVINETVLVPRDKIHKYLYRGRPLPKTVGLLVRRPPNLFRENDFIRISLSTFKIVSTGTLGKALSFP